MSVHNVDEILWLTGEHPVAAATMGSRVFSQSHSPVVEDFDDGFLQMWFESGMMAQVQVGRNHVAGYRVETWIYGDKGTMHVGRFTGHRSEVLFEVHFPGEPSVQKTFAMRDYGEGLPEFVDRFGLAYRAELAHFIDCCRNDKPFGVNQNDGVRAMEVISAGMNRPTTGETASKIEKVAEANLVG
jgi:predicted dehydrogenase